MGKYQAAAVGQRGNVQEPADVGLDRGVEEFANRGIGQGYILNGGSTRRACARRTLRLRSEQVTGGLCLHLGFWEREIIRAGALTP